MSAHHAIERLEARRRARRSAWVLALVVACVYGGVILWHVSGGAS